MAFAQLLSQLTWTCNHPGNQSSPLYYFVNVGDKSPCQILRDELNGKKLIGAYIPRCTDHGEFEALQCHTNGECWCVNYEGGRIPGTLRRQPERPKCRNVGESLAAQHCPRAIHIHMWLIFGFEVSCIVTRKLGYSNATCRFYMLIYVLQFIQDKACLFLWEGGWWQILNYVHTYFMLRGQALLFCLRCYKMLMQVTPQFMWKQGNFLTGPNDESI